jgi:hypothetical protein
MAYQSKNFENWFDIDNNAEVVAAMTVSVIQGASKSSVNGTRKQK